MDELIDICVKNMVSDDFTEEQARALVVVTLYGCTDSSIYYHLAHEAIDPWKKEEKPKKNKQQLINRLADYDRWLRH